MPRLVLHTLYVLLLRETLWGEVGISGDLTCEYHYWATHLTNRLEPQGFLNTYDTLVLLFHYWFFCIVCSCLVTACPSICLVTLFLLETYLWIECILNIQLVILSVCKGEAGCIAIGGDDVYC